MFRQYTKARQGVTQKEYDWLKRIENGTDRAWNDLTDWEQRFIEDLLERFRKWGIKTYISNKQWGIIARISEKIV